MNKFIMTKNGRANKRVSSRLKFMEFIYTVEKIDIGKYIYTVIDPDPDKWKYLKDMLGEDDFVYNENE